MKLIFLALMCLVLFSACRNGYGYQPPSSESVAVDGIHGLLTRIEYGDNVAYIMGSMHMGRPHWFPLAGVVEDAMRRADVFAFEFDFTLRDDPLVMVGLQEHLLLPQGMTLLDVLTPQGLENFFDFLEIFSSDL